MTHIRKTVLIHAPMNQIHDLARDPQRWNTWLVGLSEPEEIKGKGETGTVVKARFTIAGMTFPVTTTVVDESADPAKTHWKGSIEGPLSGTQEWNCVAKGSETEVTADVEYNVPGKAFGKFADRLIIERLMEKSMEHTLENLKLVCETPGAVRAA